MANTWEFTLAQASKISAAIFHPTTGVMIRTLISAQSYAAGNHTVTWDGLNDAGVAVEARGDYVLKKLIHDVSYQWMGAVANSSTQSYGVNRLNWLRGINSMCINGNTAYCGLGFSESNINQIKIDLATDLHYKYPILEPEHGDANAEIIACDTDGTRVYWACFDPNTPANSWTFATKVSDDTDYLFTDASSTSQATTWGRTYPKVIDKNANASQRPTGIAVQKGANVNLFIAHSGLNQIKVYNKTTGLFIRNITRTSVRHLRIDSNNNLWLVTGTNSVTKHTINSNGTISTALLTITSVSKPLGLDISTDGSTIAIIDGGSSQQIKAFNTSTGASVWTLGQAGGYTSNSNVSTDRFMFDHPVIDKDGIHTPFIAFTSSNIYVGDPGNFRVLKYDLSRNHVDTLSAFRMLYNVGLIKNATGRLLADWLEYSIDYSKTLGPRNGSWTLSKNYAGGIVAGYMPSFSLDLRAFRTGFYHSASGRTYTIVTYTDLDQIRYPEIAELTSNSLRLTGIRGDAFALWDFDTNGDIYYIEGDRDNAGTTVRYYKKTLLSIDGSGNPVYSAELAVNTLNNISASEPAYKGYTKPFVSSTGKYFYFAKFKENEGYHFGASTSALNSFLWKVSPSTTSAYSGDYPNDNKFDIGNGVEYPGGDLYGIGRNVFWNYMGEFWKNSQVNKHHHHLDSGLLVGIFGVTIPEVEAIDGKWSPRQAAGNVQAPVVEQAPSGDLYVYTQDESFHSGPGVWKISNLSSIDESQQNISTPGWVDAGSDINYTVLSSAITEATSTLILTPNFVFESQGNPIAEDVCSSTLIISNNFQTQSAQVLESSADAFLNISYNYQAKSSQINESTCQSNLNVNINASAKSNQVDEASCLAGFSIVQNYLAQSESVVEDNKVQSIGVALNYNTIGGLCHNVENIAHYSINHVFNFVCNPVIETPIGLTMSIRPIAASGSRKKIYII